MTTHCLVARVDAMVWPDFAVEPMAYIRIANVRRRLVARRADRALLASF